jgi:glycosyltransferase involved in cell wall biosynthesis
MRILYLTAGAAEMYCGSCLRDNALAAELKKRGHDVLLLPMYTPTLTDEPNVSYEKVFFGGISVYLEQYFSFFRRAPRVLDKIFDSKLMLKLASKRSIKVDPKMLGEMTVSILKGEHGHQQREIEKLIEWLKHEEPFDVISLPYTLLIALAKPIKRTTGREIFCTLQGEDLFLENLQEPYKSESLKLIREQVNHVDTFISVSNYYAHFMSDYLHIPEDKIRVVPLGINLEGYEMRVEEKDKPFTIGFFARVAPEKGLHVLAEAYKILKSKFKIQNSRLEVAGYLGAEHRDYFRDVEKKIKAWGFADEFNYHGVLDKKEKIDFLRGLDVLSVPATYNEPKGIFLLEAFACGVPAVQPKRGAFTEVIEKTKGGLLVGKDSPEKLAEGIFELYQNISLRNELGRNGYDAVREHYNVGLMAERVLETFSSDSLRKLHQAKNA